MSTKNSRCLKGLFALIHKNWIYTKRQWLVSIFELIVPCLLMLIMVLIRQNTKLTKFDSQNFESPFIIVERMEYSDATYIHYPLIYDPIS